MEVFQDKLKELIDGEDLSDTHPINQIYKDWKKIAPGCTDETNLPIEIRELIHDALDRQTDYLLKLKQVDVLNVLVAHITVSLMFLFIWHILWRVEFFRLYFEPTNSDCSSGFKDSTRLSRHTLKAYANSLVGSNKSSRRPGFSIEYHCAR
jgi:hypothetical protein